MPGSGKYTQYQPDDVTSGKKLVLSNQKLLSKAFATHPDETSADPNVAQNAVVNDGNLYLLPTTAPQKGDPSYFPNGVNLQFAGIPNVMAGAPDITTVPVGGGGLPSTPWTPPIASPGEGNGADPSKQPDLGIGLANIGILNKSAQPGVNGLEAPNADANVIGPSVKISVAAGSLPLGGHPGGKPPKFD